MTEFLISMAVVVICAMLYNKILDKLGLKEKTRQIAVLVLHAIIVIFILMYYIVLQVRYVSSWLLFLYVCICLIRRLLEFFNRKQDSDRLHKWERLSFWSIGIAFLIEVFIR